MHIRRGQTRSEYSRRQSECGNVLYQSGGPVTQARGNIPAILSTVTEPVVDRLPCRSHPRRWRQTSSRIREVRRATGPKNLTTFLPMPTVDDMGDMRINWTRDEIILACDLVWANEWRALDAGRAEVVELSELLRQSPLHPREGRPLTFRNPAGVGRKTSDIATRHPDYAGKPTRGNRIDQEVLQDFLERPEEMHRVAGGIRTIIQGGAVLHSELSLLEGLLGDELEAPEGRLLRSWQVKRERDPNLRMRKIQQVKQRGEPVACAVCSFDFFVTYGERGRDYIEVHHVTPLHVSGETKTRLGDLALLCSNCHRMIHRGPWLNPQQLQELYGSAPQS